jgi:DNA (cytosine-5)-methyltransferase 1
MSNKPKAKASLFEIINSLPVTEREKLTKASRNYSQRVNDLLLDEEAQLYLNKWKEPKFKTNLSSEFSFTFIDLFAGIGGFRLALQELGGECVFTSEWEKKAQETYFENFGDIPYGDITTEETKAAIPKKFDVLCAGFPCQAFSIAGKRGGFEDTRGTLFFDVAEIIKQHRPKAVFLENVKGLVNHKSGKTLNTILNVLRNDLDYIVPEPRILNAKHYGVPQNRERIFIVGFRKEDYELAAANFQYPKPSKKKITIKKILEKHPVPARYYLSKQYLNTLIEHKRRHAEKGNGFGYEIISEDEIANAIVVGGMGRERNLVIDDRLTDFTPETHIKGEINRQGVRKMTPREWARLQGFPDNYEFPVADVHAYKQLGNSVAVPAIQATAKEILKII